MASSSLSQRLKTLQSRLSNLACDAVLFTDPISLHYLTGMHFSAGQLLVTTANAHLILDGRYAEGARARSPIPLVLASDTALEHRLQGVATLGFCHESSYQQFQELKDKLKCTLKPIENPLVGQRLIKDPDEIQRLREAAKLGSEGFDYVCSLLREGITERELAAELTIFWLKRGAQKLAFAPIIAFEPGNSEPHYTPRDVPLKLGQSVLIDIGVMLNDYNSDMTRTVFFGKPQAAMLKIYDVVKKAQETALALCRPGTTTVELDRAARKVIEDAGYGEAFSHSLGHGIGLEIHESPRIHSKKGTPEVVLQPGMAITIEPGVYVPGVGGVRIEDTVVITKDGYEDLTQRSKDVTIVP